jgi:DNA-binding transcriptional MerR regulator
MSDEYLNNEEETSALFVSAKKKKQAEEEAARKAAEEQAKREAAEAEVRRMEAEVEERKRKAEEERKALEEQEKQLAEEKASGAKKANAEPKAKKEKKESDKGSAMDSIKSLSSGKSKLPLFIGIGAVAVVAIVLILIFALKGKGGKAMFDPATTEFNAEYVCKEEGFDLKFSYPDSIYKEVTEEKTGDDEITVHFGGMDVIISTYKYDDQDQIIDKLTAYIYPANGMQKGFQEKVSKRIDEIAPDMKTVSETGVDVGSDSAVKYSYKRTFESAEAGNGAANAWIEPNSAGECKRVIVCVKDKGANVEECAKICDAFEEKNSQTAIPIPGGNPTTATDSDGTIEIDEMHMGLVVPKDVFFKLPGTDYPYYVDADGVSIIVKPEAVSAEVIENAPLENFEKLFKEYAERGINDYFKGVDSRMFMDEEFQGEEAGLFYNANYKDMIGGVTYWERFRAAYWYDTRTDQDYIYTMITVVPEKNKDVYKPIFDKMIDRLKDL